MNALHKQKQQILSAEKSSGSRHLLSRRRFNAEVKGLIAGARVEKKSKVNKKHKKYKKHSSLWSSPPLVSTKKKDLWWVHANNQQYKKEVVEVLNKTFPRKTLTDINQHVFGKNGQPVVFYQGMADDILSPLLHFNASTIIAADIIDEAYINSCHQPSLRMESVKHDCYYAQEVMLSKILNAIFQTGGDIIKTKWESIKKNNIRKVFKKHLDLRNRNEDIEEEFMGHYPDCVERYARKCTVQFDWGPYRTRRTRKLVYYMHSNKNLFIPDEIMKGVDVICCIGALAPNFQHIVVPSMQTQRKKGNEYPLLIGSINVEDVPPSLKHIKMVETNRTFSFNLPFRLVENSSYCDEKLPGNLEIHKQPINLYTLN